MTRQELLLAAIKSRRAKGFGGGITTADSYVTSVGNCIGPELCYRNFAKSLKGGYSTLLKEAGNTLVYAGPQWSVEKRVTRKEEMKLALPEGMELPQHSMMLIRNVLTTPKEDRDRDVLETAGARPDSKMPLLWQHLHTLPIGKAIGIAEHTAEVLKLFTVLLDINDLTADACKLVEAEVLRFSHGFRALEYQERKADGNPSGEYIGFRVTEFEIMEQSLVSVASNTEAEPELWGRVAVKSPVFKAYQKSIQDRHRRPHGKGFGAGIKTPKGVVNFDSLGDLKNALDSGLIQVSPFGGKAQDPAMVADQFSTAEQAEARAKELGCDGSHQWVDINGDPIFMPCKTHADYLHAGIHAHPEPAGTETTMAAAQNGQAKGAKADIADPMAGEVDLFENPVDAETRADAMGCIGYHEVGGKYRPCGTAEAYAQQVITTGTAGHQGHGKKAGGCGCQDGAKQFEALTKTISGVTLARRPEPNGAKYLDSGMLVGSFNWIYEQLQEGSRKYLMMAGIDLDMRESVYVASLWADYGLICCCDYDTPGDPVERYFQASYAIAGDSCGWTGTPTQVEVSTTVAIQAVGATSFAARLKRLGALAKLAKKAGDKTEAMLAIFKAVEGLAAPANDKAGRALSAKNLATLQEVHDDLKEIGVMADVPRAAAALAERCHGKVKGMIDSAGTEEGDGKSSEPAKPAAVVDAKAAAAMLLMSDDVSLLKRTHDAIGGILAAENTYTKGDEYRKLFATRR